jgi:pimeloyl-ACP methyl ester carboxylesterase
VADRHVIAVDLRCARRSEKPTGSFSLAEVADDLGGWSQALDLQNPSAPTAGVAGEARLIVLMRKRKCSVSWFC